MSCEEQRAIREHRAEATHDEEEKLDDREKDRPVDELVEDNTQSSMQNSAMFEQQVADTVDITHLHV